MILDLLDELLQPTGIIERSSDRIRASEGLEPSGGASGAKSPTSWKYQNTA